MRRWLVDLHLYLGLFSLPYVVLFGVSSILLNHDFRSEARVVRWERTISVPRAGAPLERARAVRDALGLHGLVHERQVRQAEGGALRFRIIYPARRTEVEVDRSGRARVAERYFGLAAVIRALHGFHGWDVSAWGYSWMVFTDFSLAAFAFFTVTGVWLAWLRVKARAPLMATGALATLVTGVLAAAIW
jgi:hypothetical protein